MVISIENISFRVRHALGASVVLLFYQNVWSTNKFQPPMIEIDLQEGVIIIKFEAMYCIPIMEVLWEVFNMSSYRH